MNRFVGHQDWPRLGVSVFSVERSFISNEIDIVEEREKKNKVYSMEATIG